MTLHIVNPILLEYIVGNYLATGGGWTRRYLPLTLQKSCARLGLPKEMHVDTSSRKLRLGAMRSDHADLSDIIKSTRRLEEDLKVTSAREQCR